MESARLKISDLYAVKMADEGIPIRAITRILKDSYDYISLILREANDQGELAQLPPDEWPHDTNQQTRYLPSYTLTSLDEPALYKFTMRAFGVTNLEAALLLTLLKRQEASRTTLHFAVKNRWGGTGRDTEPKLIDVAVCKLRVKLKKFNIEITTDWGNGYAISSIHRVEAVKLLEKVANNGKTN